jgi:cobalt-zinc-cadmium efflux system outer membrane protein
MHPFAIRLIAFAATVSCLSAFPGVAAEPAPISLPQALERALRDNPQLARFPFRLRAAQSLRDQAGRRPNPELTLEAENAAGSGPYGGFDSAEITLSLSQVLELGGKRGLRRDLADAELGTLTLEQRLAELDVAAETARRFVGLVEAQALLELAGRRLDLAHASEAQVEARVTAGRSSIAERHKARLEVLEAGLAKTAAEREVEVARHRLASSWGAVLPDFGVARADLYALPDPGPLEALVARVLEGPDLARFVSERRRREAELALARGQGTQNLAVGGGLRRFEATGDTAFNLGFSMPLPFADRNQGGIAAARERVGELEAEQNAARLEARVIVTALWTRLAQTSAAAGVLGGEARAEAEKALAATEQGYVAGRLSLLELSDARRLLLGVQDEAVRTAAEHHRLLIELERLTGRPAVAP